VKKLMLVETGRLTLAEALFKGKHHGEQGSHSKRLSTGHRVPVHEFSQTSAMVYPTNRPEERKSLTPSTGADYTSNLIGKKVKGEEDA